MVEEWKILSRVRTAVQDEITKRNRWLFIGLTRLGYAVPDPPMLQDVFKIIQDQQEEITQLKADLAQMYEVTKNVYPR